MPSSRKTSSPRKEPSKTLTDSVMKEFHHLCALCGKRSPQLHHIDKNRNNNTAINLLPMCPNHHLLDAHSPTDPISVEKLQLFREFKDPTVFLSQFEPILSRITFLLDSEETLSKRNDILPSLYDLIDFLNHLKMGGYYAKRISKVLALGQLESYDSGKDKNGQPDYIASAVSVLERAAAGKSFSNEVVEARTKAIELIIECLRYQEWKAVPPYTEA